MTKSARFAGGGWRPGTREGVQEAVDPAKGGENAVPGDRVHLGARSPEAQHPSGAIGQVVERNVDPLHLRPFQQPTPNPLPGEPQVQALLQLGLALGRLGQRDEACVTLNEVTVRFPDAGAAAEAQNAAGTLGCG